MTDKKSLFVRHGLVSDLMLGLIVFLTVQSGLLFLMFGYIQEMGLRYICLYLPVLYVPAFLVLRRLRVRQLYMIGSHVLCVALVAALIGLICRAAPMEITEVALSGAIQAAYSMSQRYKTEEMVVDTGILFPSLAVNLISFLVISYFGKSDFMSIILVNSVLIITFFFVARQNNVLEVDYHHSLKSEARNDNSVKRQNRQNMIIIVLGIVLSLILLLCFPADEVSRLIAWLIVSLIDLLLRMLPQSRGGTAVTGYRLVPGEEEPMQGGEANIFLKIFILLLFLFVLAVFFTFLVYVVKAFLNRYRMAEDHHSASSDGAVVDLVENIGRTKRSRREALDFGKGYEKEIRKRFYHKARKGMKAGLPIGKTSSPRQIENVLLTNGDASMPELTDAYEKVRYSRRSVVE